VVPDTTVFRVEGSRSLRILSDYLARPIGVGALDSIRPVQRMGTFGAGGHQLPLAVLAAACAAHALSPGDNPRSQSTPQPGPALDPSRVIPQIAPDTCEYVLMYATMPCEHVDVSSVCSGCR